MDETEFLTEKEIEQSFEMISRPARYIRGVGPKVAVYLERMGINSVEDMLFFLPRRYEDRRTIEAIDSLSIGKAATVMGTVINAGFRYYRKAKVFEVIIDDESGLLTAKWFRGRDIRLRKIFQIGRRVIMTGEIRGSLFTKEMAHPDFETIDDEEDGRLHFKRIVPVYSETEGLRQKQIRRIMRNALDQYASFVLHPTPKDICVRQGLAEIAFSLENVHFPGHGEDIHSYNSGMSAPHRRLIFDDFFYFEVAMAIRKMETANEKGISFSRDGTLVNQFLINLPFQLTDAQKRIILEIDLDMADHHPMNRLLQGDVGCGKTVVAMAALIRAVENGFQGAVMAPTEILAAQHYSTAVRWAEPLGISVVLLTGSIGSREREIALGKIERGDAKIIIGTHALIQEKVKFRQLGLVVIDEQHRFGVIQRQMLREKGLNPHVLVMTATPIPRTLAMTVYGDLDLSIIDEMPPGRLPVVTKVYDERRRAEVYDLIRKEVAYGRQAFIVYPLVEASEILELKDATRMAEHLQASVFPELKVGLVHGRMKGSEKNDILDAFAHKRLDILVSTTVLEVGIDIPEASLIIIEHAERFGLSQLHQLRGRIGRSGIQSMCILMRAHNGSDAAGRRLRIMEQTNDGFRIAEEDLMIRGPGEFLGTRQSGLPEFKVADILKNAPILHEAREEAFSLVKSDPRLEKGENKLLKKVVMRKWGSRIAIIKTG